MDIKITRETRLLTILFFLIFFVTIGAVNAAVQAEYRFDADCTTDSTGNGNTLTNTGGVSNVAFGLQGNSCYFNNSDYLYRNAAVSGGIGTDWTITGWVNTNSTAEDYYFDFNTGGDRTIIAQTATNSYLQHYDGTAWRISTTPMDGGEWQHFAIIRAGTAYDFFVNGTNVTSSTGTARNLDAQYAIGAGQGTGSSPFQGYMDNICILDEAISAANVTANYNSGAGNQCDFDATPVTTYSNYTTIQTGNTYFNNTVNIGTTYGTVASTTIEILNATEAYFTSSIGVDGGSATAECRIDVNGSYYGSTTQRSLSGNKGNIYLSTNVANFTPANYTTQIECRKIGGSNYDVEVAGLTIYELYDAGVETAIHTNQFNDTNVALTASQSLASSYQFKTSSNYNASSTNNLTAFINWRMSYSFGAGASTINTTLEFAGTNCTSYPRSGSAGSTGSVSGACLVSGLTNDTTYDLRVYGRDGAGTSDLDDIKIYVSELIQHNNTINKSEVSSSGVTTRTKIAEVNLSNPLGGNYNIYAKAATNTQNASGSATQADYELEIDGTISGIYSRDYTGIGNVAFEDVVAVSGTGTKTVSLYATCSAACDVITGDLVAFATDAATASDNTFIAYAWDQYNGSMINAFNVTLGGATFTTTNASVVVIGDGGTQTATTQSTGYFTNTTSHDTTTNLNATLYRWTAIYGYNVSAGTYVENFTVNYNSTTYNATGITAYIPLYNESTNIQLNASGFAIATENLTANPYLENHTFNLYTTNTFNITIYNETSNELLTGYTITWEIISTLETRNGTTANGTIIEELLTPGNYEIIYARESTRPRSYFITLTNQSLQNIRLYLIDEAISSSYIPLVTDENQDACSQNLISLMRYYIDINGYRTVAMTQTDTNGYGLFYVEPNTINYKLYFNGTCGTFTTVPQKIIAATNSFTVTDAQTVLSGAEAIAGSTISLDYINATQTYVFDWQDSTNTITEGCLYVYRTYRGAKSTNYTACSSASTGSLIYTLTGNLTNTIWDAQGIIKTASSYSTHTYSTPTINFLESLTNWGVTGVFFGMITILALVLLLGSTPGTIIITTIGSFAVLATLGIIAGVGSVVIGVVILGGVMLYKIRTP